MFSLIMTLKFILIKPISVVVHNSMSHVCRDCLNFLSYYFLEGGFWRQSWYTLDLWEKNQYIKSKSDNVVATQRNYTCPRNVSLTNASNWLDVWALAPSCWNHSFSRGYYYIVCHVLQREVTKHGSVGIDVYIL